MQNSIDYPGEQVNPQNGKKPWIVHQPAYVGKNYFMVNYAGRTVIVHAADKTAALFFAAKHWGYSFRRPEYHQSASVDKLPYTPGRPGETL